MYYKGFRTHITRRFGVILKNWPLKKFVTPSQITSFPELNVLYNAFKNGTAAFVSLTPEEWAAWDDSGKPVVTGIAGVPLGEDAENAAASTSVGASSTHTGASSAEPQAGSNANADASTPRPDASTPRPDASTPPPDASTQPPDASSPPPVLPERIPTPPIGAPQSESFTFSFGDGAPVAAPKKRKTRSDKGKPRGPNTRTKGQPASKRRQVDEGTSAAAS